MLKQLMNWHRRIALVLLVPILLFCLSGLLHPTMRLTAPELANRSYSQPNWPEQLPAIEPLISALGIEYVAGFRPVQVGQQWQLQLWQDRDTSASFHSFDGQPKTQLARDYALQLARHFSGNQTAAVTEVSLITEFSPEYPPINRLLPVWKVRFDQADGLTLFVDIRQDRLAATVDNTRRMLMKTFRLLHSWSFLEGAGVVKTLLFVAMMSGALLMATLGLWLFLRLPSRRTQQPLSRWHRWLGLTSSLALLMFLVSGLVRVVEKQTPEVRGVALQQNIAISQLKLGFNQMREQFPKVHNIYLHQLDGRPVWQLIQPRKADIWLDGVSGKPLEQGAKRFVYQLLTELQAATAGDFSARRVTSFRADADYGFIDKRLPVTALDFAEYSYYVDTRDAVLSLKVDNSDRAFSWVFRYLHKWRFADGLGRNGRDGIMAIVVLAISLAAVFGVVSWWRGVRKRRRAIANRAAIAAA